MPYYISDEDGEILKRIIDRERRRTVSNPERISAEDGDRENLIGVKHGVFIVKAAQYNEVEFSNEEDDPDLEQNTDEENEDIEEYSGGEFLHGGLCDVQYLDNEDEGDLDKAKIIDQGNQIPVYNLSGRKMRKGDSALAFLTNGGKYVAIGTSAADKFYVEGTPTEDMGLGDVVTMIIDYPPGTGTGTDPEGNEVYVIGNWFSAEAGERIGAIWYEGLGMYVAIAKRCPDTSSSTGSGTGIFGG